jgi:NADH:ubiquinone oxidoreductase subunit F (NADH-binding)
VQSFFAGASEGSVRVSVCRGLSCELNGGRDVASALRTSTARRELFCLGYCDRSPALLTADGEVRFGARALAWPDEAAAGASRPDIRAAARRPVVTERIARGDYSSLTRARQAGVYAGLARALAASPGEVLAAVEASGEQGRGGAGFPTGRKWRAAASIEGARRFVIANGDEGDPGSFIDRVLLEDDPHAIIEGLALCGFAVGASEGIVFIRAEYPLAQARVSLAITEAREAGLLGASVLGYPFSFDLRVVSGHGSYVCGEETALLNAIEGRRGEVRVRPPFPAEKGLYASPTVVNNIETLANIPWIIREGAQAYRDLGTATSPGTKAFCLGRGFTRPGIVEAEFGLTFRQLIEEHGGGFPAPLAAVLLGGPMGSVLTPDQWDIALDYPVLRERGVRLGHGGLVPIARGAGVRTALLNAAEFMAAESCGKCVPCAQGSRRARDIVRRMVGASASADAGLVAELAALLTTVEATSLCGFGQGIPQPLLALARLARNTVDGAGDGRG